jgi:Asp-tRNA(Asn)/Glu-tRNA(Gln) amidotransferase B subunit
MSIEEIAKEVIENILELYKKKKWTKKKLEEFVNEQLKNYSDEVKKIIEQKLQETLGGFYYVNDNPQIAITL